MQIEFFYQNLFLAAHQGCDQWQMRESAVQSVIEPTPVIVQQRSISVSGTVWNIEQELSSNLTAAQTPTTYQSEHCGQSRGRPKVRVNLDLLFSSLNEGAGQRKTAKLFGISERTLRRLIKQKTLKDKE